MNQEPFPKPTPADPHPLEVWLNLPDRAEVGREAFFRGRDTEYDVFRRAVNNLRAGHIGGGTMIFQGTPGVGKTALMQECKEAIRHHSSPEEPWVAADIQFGTLAASAQFMWLLIHAINEENERLAKEFPYSDYFRFRKVMKLGKKLLKELGDRDYLVSNPKAEWVFSKAAPFLKEFHVVVMVDEAQNTPTTRHSTRDVIECLHNPPDKIPLVTAFFGLSNTQIVLGECGLDRLPAEQLVNMEAMEVEYAASAIRGVFDAYGFKGKLEDREVWIDSLAKLSQGFPQHINSVSVAAAGIIHKHDGRILMEHLDEALECGLKWLNAYYYERVAVGFSDVRVYRQLALAIREKGRSLSRDEIGSIAELALKKELQTFDEFLTLSLSVGLLAPDQNNPSHYKIPIPLMGDYLRKIP